MIAKFYNEVNFADFLGQKRYRYLEHWYKLMMPAKMESHPSVCGFYTIHAAFTFVKFYQEEITGVQNFTVVSSKSI